MHYKINYSFLQKRRIGLTILGVFSTRICGGSLPTHHHPTTQSAPKFLHFSNGTIAVPWTRANPPLDGKFPNKGQCTMVHCGNGRKCKRICEANADFASLSQSQLEWPSGVMGTIFVDLTMNFLYILVMVYVKLYKFLHLMVVKYNEKVLTLVLIKKIQKLGVNVVFDTKDKNAPKVDNSLALQTQLSDNLKGPTLTIKDPRFFVSICQDRTLGFGESFMEGWWECDQLVELCERFVNGKLLDYKRNFLDNFAHYLEYQLFNLQTIPKSLKVAKTHYDQGNEVFEKMLGPTMNYSCGYWRKAKTLEEAQTHKMDLIAHKLKLRPGMRVLDIGCGWGALARHLAKNYKVSVVAVSIAKEGCKYAEKICKGLPVEVRLCDYRMVNEKFDRIVSVGMAEHVGPKNYDTYFEVVDRCLVDQGLFLLHTIGNDDVRKMRDDPYNNTYIFLNGSLPRATELTHVARKRFTLEDWHNFGPDYARTLMCWYDNLVANWDSVKHLYPNPTKSFRLWTTMTHFSAAAFNCRYMQLWQIVFSKNGFPGGYESLR